MQPRWQRYIGLVATYGLLPRDGGDVHDARGGGGAQQRQEQVGEQEGADVVRREDELPALRGDVGAVPRVIAWAAALW